MKIYDGFSDLIGHTPMVRLGKIEKEAGLSTVLLGKLESANPGGSAKDRVAATMIRDAENRGLLKPGSVIIEPTSGNTGIGLAAVAATKGYRVILTMPETMSIERQRLLRAYGAELVLTPGDEGMDGAIRQAEVLAAKIPESFIPGQFDNPSNPAAHLETTAPEIWEDTDGTVDIFVAGIGTGGTISGIGSFLKAQNPQIQVIGVEPAASPVLSGGGKGAHGLMGIGAGFVPEVLDTEIYDEIIPVTEEEAYEMGRKMAKKEGLLVGISAGAALSAAIRVAKRAENQGKTIVVLLPDTGERYLSTPMFSEE